LGSDFYVVEKPIDFYEVKNPFTTSIFYLLLGVEGFNYLLLII
jgi:hypothetical protein